MIKIKLCVLFLKQSAFVSVFDQMQTSEKFSHNLVSRVLIIIPQSGSKMPAITNLRFFLAALIKPIHADLLLINFVRRKGRVCIFATRVSSHFKGFILEAERSETPHPLEQT